MKKTEPVIVDQQVVSRLDSITSFEPASCT